MSKQNTPEQSNHVYTHRWFTDMRDRQHHSRFHTTLHTHNKYLTFIWYVRDIRWGSYSVINDSLLRESRCCWSKKTPSWWINYRDRLVLTSMRFHKIRHILASDAYFLKIKRQFFLKLDDASIFVVIRAEIMFYKKKLRFLRRAVPGCATRKKMPTWRPSTGNTENTVKLFEISASRTVITHYYWCFHGAGVLTQSYRRDGRCVRPVKATIHHAVSFQATFYVISRSAVHTVHRLVQIYIDCWTFRWMGGAISTMRDGEGVKICRWF